MIIETIQASVYRVPIDKPLRASFGEMRDRPAVLIRVTAEDGTFGYGESWCNFPTVGAEHRARLIRETLAPLVIGRPFTDPRAIFEHLTTTLHVLAIQAGEPGPIAQAIAGVDIALWDALSRAAGEPLHVTLARRFGQTPRTDPVAMPCYASGLGPDAPQVQALAARQQGHRAFKLKVGFGSEIDLANLAAMRAALGDAAPIALDANQRWQLAQAIEFARQLDAHGPLWLEEPLPADRPAGEWQSLAKAIATPLAGGENLRGDSLTEAIHAGYLTFVQPDIAKWGGFSAGYPMARAIARAGKTYCPHYLGGGIGLMASAHLLAAAGGPGLLEVDVNPNPLRTLLADPLPAITDGRFRLDDRPGLGIEPRWHDLQAFQKL